MRRAYQLLLWPRVAKTTINFYLSAILTVTWQVTVRLIKLFDLKGEMGNENRPLFRHYNGLIHVEVAQLCQKPSFSNPAHSKQVHPSLFAWSFMAMRAMHKHMSNTGVH